MDTLKGLQRLFGEAKKESVSAFDVADAVRRQIGPPVVERAAPPTLVVWKVSAAASALAALIPLALTVKTFLTLDDFVTAFFPLTEGAWLW
jgi:hypothetical protein